MNKALLRIQLPVMMIALLLAGSEVQAQEDRAARLQARLNALYEETDLPGVSAAVAMPDGTIIPLVAGMADRETGQAMTADARLMQGSVGKTYVAAVALQLVSEGKLSLNDKVEKHLGGEEWFARLPNASDITVRMLMNHTSGLVRYEFQPRFLEDLTAEPQKRWSPHEQLAYILDTKAPFAAGQGWEYSDTNYIVLGLIIEKVAGGTYHHELRRRLLEPLKLDETVPVDGPDVPGLAQGYAGERNPFGGKDRMLGEDGRMIINPQFEWTGGGIASTTGDLARWAKLLYEGMAFDAKLLPEMLEGTPAPPLGREAQYGLGVILRPTELGPTYGHSGYFPGYMTEVMYWPDLKIAVAVQVNTSVGRSIRPPLARWCVELAQEAAE
jgi:D-alanyl-D-alanine carboxypeptidase